MIKAVLDTNVLISAIISDGKSRELLKKGITNQFQIVTSDLILKELAKVLCRPKFKTSQAEIDRIIIGFRRTAEVVGVKSKLEVVKEDPKDDMVIETALDGKVQLIVTGDNHLLALNNYGAIKIVTIEEMLAYLK
ncbi:MAG: putative toxin-antitoxin system toxin component, PIN family [Candidatus Bathyarchaeia archaeon]|jgi:putative PIN family toxin of toxin-antitoxin system